MAKNQLKAFIGLHRAVNYLDKEVSNVHARFGLTLGQFAVLEALYHKGDLAVGQVQEKILSSSGTMPIIVKNLESRGYLIKKTDETDKRKTILSLTDVGRELMQAAYPANEERILQLLEVVSAEELEILVGILKKIKKAEDSKQK